MVLQIGQAGLPGQGMSWQRPRDGAHLMLNVSHEHEVTCSSRLTRILFPFNSEHLSTWPEKRAPKPPGVVLKLGGKVAYELS